MDLFGSIVLFFALIVVGALQVGALFGVMFAMYKNADALKVDDHHYGRFNFDHFDKNKLPELLTRLAIIVLPLALVLHFAEFWTVGLYIRAHYVIVTIVLLLFETAGIAAGLHFIFRLDPKKDVIRLSILTGASSLFYLLIYWIFLYDKLN